MDKQSVSNAFKVFKAGISKHSPEILTGIGIAGMITTTILAVKATPKALRLIEEAEDKKLSVQVKEGVKPSDRDCSLTTVETIKVAWKPYIPAVVTGTVSIVCLIGASSVHTKRNAALATAYQLSSTAFSEYKEKVIETIGEKKEKTVREKVAQKKVDEHPVSQNQVIVAGSGDVLFLEPVSMRYFTSDIERVRRVINDINYRMVTGMEGYISLSEFYDEIGLPHTNQSDDIGWNMYRDGQIETTFSPTIAEDGKPCLMLEFMVSPRYEYEKLM